MSVALGTAGSFAFLSLKHTIPVSVDVQLVSGSYNCLLLLFTFGSILTLHSLLSPARGSTALRNSGPGAWTASAVASFLAAIAAGLVAVNLFDYFLKWLVQFEYRRVMPLFDLSKEANLPTLFSTALLLVCTVLLAAIAVDAKRHGRENLHWMSLSAILAFLALDEFAGLHEASNAVVRRSLPALRASGREWILLYGAMLIPLAAVYLPFILKLRSATRRLVLIAAFLYLSGGLRLETLSGWWSTAATRGGWLDFLLFVSEEALEMAGAIVLIYALLEFMEHGGIHFRVGAIRGQDSWPTGSPTRPRE